MDEKRLDQWKHWYFHKWAEAKWNEQTFQEEIWTFMLDFGNNFSEEKITTKRLFQLLWKRFISHLKRKEDVKDLLLPLETGYKNKVEDNKVE